MAWVNHPNFRLGALDRASRTNPQLAAQSLASADNVLVNSAGSVVKRPGFEDLSVFFDTPFVTVPYYTESETYLLVFTYGKQQPFSASAGDSVSIASTGAVTQTLSAGSAIHNPVKGDIYLYKVSQEDAREECDDCSAQGIPQPVLWATHKHNYLYGNGFLIRRAQQTISSAISPDLSHYEHSFGEEQVKGIQYAQVLNSLYVFIDGFPPIEISRATGSFDSSANAVTSSSAVYAHEALDLSTELVEANRTGNESFLKEPWHFEVDVLEPELYRNASPPINLLMTSATKLVTSQEFFTGDMAGGVLSVGQTKTNTGQGSLGDGYSTEWSSVGVPSIITTVINSRIATVGGVEGSGFLDYVPNTYSDGTETFGQTISSNTLHPGDVDTKDSTFMRGHVGPWVKKKDYVAFSGDGSYTMTLVNASAVAGSPYYGNAGFWYSADTNDNDIGGQLKTHLGLNESDVGSIVCIYDDSENQHLKFLLYNVTSTSGNYDYSGHLRYHFQSIGVFDSSSSMVNQTYPTIGDGNHDFTNSDTVALYKVESPNVYMGSSGWEREATSAVADQYKATVFVNDEKYLPNNLEKGNRPLKIKGPTNPTFAGGSIFYNDGIFRPTARISNVAYEGYWSKLPAHGGPQNFVSYGMGGATKFPTCGTAEQGRLVLGGFDGDFEDTIAFSRTNQPRQMRVSFLNSADDPFAIQLGQNTEEKISWFSSTQAGLVAGGRTGEYLVRGEPISALSLGYDRVSAVGGAVIRPLNTDREVMYVTRDKKGIGGIQLRESGDQTLFSSRLSDSAQNLFDSEVQATAYVYSPFPCFFFLLKSGKVLAYTRDFNVGAFTSFSHANGRIKGITSAVRPSQLTDSAFVCVQRFIDGRQEFRLERLNFSAYMDSQRTVLSFELGNYGGETGVNAITWESDPVVRKVTFLKGWEGETVGVITVDSAGVKTYQGTQVVQKRTMTDGSTTEHYIDLSTYSLNERPYSVIIGFNFDGSFAPASMAEVPGYMCSYTSGLVLCQNASSLSVDKGNVIAVTKGQLPQDQSGWVNVYNLGHFSRDEGPTFTLKGPFGSTVESMSIEVDSED